MGYRLRSRTFKINLELYLCNGEPVPIHDKQQREGILFRDPDAQFVTETVTLAYWDFDLKSQIDMESTIVDPGTQMHYISPIKKRKLKWKYLLKDWTLTEDDGTKIEVKIDPMNRRLSDEFYSEVISGPNGISPAILDAFMSKADRVLELGIPVEEVNSLDPKV